MGAAAKAGSAQLAIKGKIGRVRNMNRRNVCKGILLGAGSAALLRLRPSRAADIGHLNVKDPAAVAQGYTEDAERIDPKQYPSFVKGSSCENCLLLQGNAPAVYRPCNLFPGKLVA